VRASVPSGPFVGPEAIKLSQLHDASKNVVASKVGEGEVHLPLRDLTGREIGLDQYALVPG
jgi:hypothetical protein